MVINDTRLKPFTEYDGVNGNGKTYNIPTDYDMLKEYSEEPDKLMELLSQIDISISKKGVVKGYFDDCDALGRCATSQKEDNSRQVVEVTMKRGATEIMFGFGLSLKDTDILANKKYSERKRVPYKEREEIWSGLLYSILACCSCDYHIPNSLQEFCEEFGYPYWEEGIATEPSKNLFIRCKEQQAKLEKIFSEDEIQCLPQ